jgi:hypothetical protein
MSIAKIEPTTKVKEWVNRINLSFDEIRKGEYCWTAVSKANQAVYDFSLAGGDSERNMKLFDPNCQYSVQYGGVILDPEDYKLEGTTLTFVNGPALENGYAIIVRYISQQRVSIKAVEEEG